MTDDRDLDFAGLDAPRPLPPALRDRLEAELTGATDAALAGLTGSDGPRPLPPRAYARVEAALRGLGGPRPIPAATRARLEAALVARRDRRATAVLGVAASLVLVLAMVSLAFRGGPRPADLPPAAAPAPSVGVTPGPAPSGVPGPGSPSPSGTPAAPPGSRTGSPPAPSPAGSGAPNAPHSPQQYTGPAPPYADANPAPRAPAARPDSAPAAGPEPPPPTPPANPRPLYVGLYDGPGPEGAGFRAYVDLLNANGGIHGHPVRLVAPGSRPVVATVNLSSETVAGRTGARPLLEPLTTPEAVLRGDVFGFSSAAERQARLAVDAVFPEPEPGASAVVYVYDEGVFGDELPAAYEAALRARQVNAVRVPVERDGSTVFPPSSDAAFLSMPLRPAEAWFDAARNAGFAPRLGVTSVGVHFDESLLDDMPAGTRVVSPYQAERTPETDDLRRRGAPGIGASEIHGWVSAKVLAVALWRSRADTPAELAAALRGLEGYSTGFFPAYDTRDGTTSRVPDGLLYEVVAGDGPPRFVARSEFRSTD